MRGNFLVPMPRNSEPPPTRDELKKAVEDLFYAAQQAAAFGYLKLIEREKGFAGMKTKIPGLDSFLNNVHFAIGVATNGVKRAANYEEKFSVRFSLRNQNVSMTRQMKIAV